MRPPASRPRLRKREIALALGAGALAAGTAAAILSDSIGDGEAARTESSVEGSLTYQVAAFDEISSVGPQEVIIQLGERATVRSEGSTAALAAFEVVVEDGELVIRPKSGRDQFDRDALEGVTFVITVPRLIGVALAGSGNMSIDRIENGEFTGTIAGSGDLSIGHMAVDQSTFAIGGSGAIRAQGSSRRTMVEIGGSGEIDGNGLTSETASVEIAGSGDVALNVSRSAEISIVGSGDVEISGGARCEINKVGGGEVRCDGPVG